MESNYRADGKAVTGQTKHSSTCSAFSERSLNCLMKNNGEKENCAGIAREHRHKCTINEFTSSDFNSFFHPYQHTAVFFDEYRECKVRARKNRFKVKKPTAPVVVESAPPAI